VAAVNFDGSSVSVLLGNGDSSFAAATNLPVTAPNPIALAAGDFNGDAG